MPRYTARAGRNISPRLADAVRPTNYGAGNVYLMPDPTTAEGTSDANSTLDSVSYDQDTGVWTVDVNASTGAISDSRQGAVWTFPLLNEMGQQCTAKEIQNVLLSLQTVVPPAPGSDLVITAGIISGSSSITTNKFLDVRIKYTSVAGNNFWEVGSGYFDTGVPASTYSVYNDDQCNAVLQIHGWQPYSVTSTDTIDFRVGNAYGVDNAGNTVGALNLGSAFYGQMSCASTGPRFFISVYRNSAVASAAQVQFLAGYRVNTNKDYSGFKNSLVIDHGSSTYSENFDSAETLPAGFSTAGDADWAIATDQSYSSPKSVKSGAITHLQQSTLELTVSADAGKIISFMLKVSTQASFDRLQFFIDGDGMRKWSGEIDWVQIAFPIPTIGSHTFSWVYVKNGAISAGDDCVWVDNITIS